MDSPESPSSKQIWVSVLRFLAQSGERQITDAEAFLAELERQGLGWELQHPIKEVADHLFTVALADSVSDGLRHALEQIEVLTYTEDTAAFVSREALVEGPVWKRIRELSVEALRYIPGSADMPDMPFRELMCYASD